MRKGLSIARELEFIPEIMWSLSKPPFSLSWLCQASLQCFQEEKKLEWVYKSPVNQRHALKRQRKWKRNMGLNIVNDILYYFSNSRIFDIDLGETWKRPITSDFLLSVSGPSFPACPFVTLFPQWIPWM